MSRGVHFHVFPDAARKSAARVDELFTRETDWVWHQLVAACAQDSKREPFVVAALPQALIDASALDPDSALADLALLNQLAHAQLTAAEFREGCEQLSGSARSSLAARRYAAWSQARAGSPFDEVGDLERARQRLEQQGLPPALLGAASIGVFLDRALSTLETSFLLTLATACERARVKLLLEIAASGESRADASLEPLFNALERQAQTLNHVELIRGQGESGEGPWMEVAAQSLGGPTEASSPTPLNVFPARSPAQEADIVARAAQRLIEDGASPSSIAVGLFDGSDEDERRFALALERRGLRVLRSMARLSAAAPARRVLELLSVVDAGYPAARIAPLLTLASDDAPAPQVLLAEAGVRDLQWGAQQGKNGYSVRLDALEQRLVRRGRAERSGHVRTLRLQWETLHAELERLPQEATVAIWLTRVWPALAARAFRAGESNGVRSAMLESVEGVLAPLSQHAVWGKRLSRAQFKVALELGWSQLPLPLDSGSDAGIRLLDAQTLAGQEFRHLFLVGLESDRFPRRGDRTALLSEDSQWQLNRWAKRSIFPAQGNESVDLLRWVQAVGAARGSLTLTFSRAGWGGEGKSPSDPLRALTQAVGVDIPGVSMARPALDTATTEDELRVIAATHVGAKTETAELVNLVLGNEPWLREAMALAAIETERLRFFSNPEVEVGAHSGAIPPSESLFQALRFGADRPLSASALGRWGNCAQQGWLTSLLRLEPRESVTEDVAPRVQGIFWHEVLERLVARLPTSSRSVTAAMVDEVLDATTQDLQGRGLACHPALWSLARQSAKQMVLRLVQTGGLFPYPQLAPSGVEVAFGSARSEEAWRTVALPGSASEPTVHFEGKIDRLDSGPNGVAVMDYKSGGPRSDRDALEDLLVTQFQLPLYLYAAKSAGHTGGMRAAWIALKTGEVRELNPLLEQVGQTVEGLLSTSLEARSSASERGAPNLANAVHGLLAPLRQGKFPTRPHDCRGCGLEAVCRVTARRMEDAP